MNRIFIIIVHFSDIETTLNCINSILNNKIKFGKIIVVNNTNQKIDLKGISKKIEIIENKKNLGFSKAVNIGIKKALRESASEVLLLNNDTLIEKLNLEKMVSKSFGIIGPIIKFNRNGSDIYDTGGKLNRIFGKTSHFEYLKIPKEKIIERDYISGCCMLISAQVFRKIGFLDEDLFLYSEDVDFCLRAREKGIQVLVNTEFIIDHLLSHSTSKNKEFAIFHQKRSAIIFGLKNLPFPLFSSFYSLLQSIILFLKDRNLGKSAFKGIKDGYMFMAHNMKYYKSK